MPRDLQNQNGMSVQQFAIPGGAVPPELLAALMGQGGKRGTVISDDDIQYHDKPSIVLPQGQPLEWAVKALTRKIEEQEEEHAFQREFLYRPEDGANATANVLKAMFGIVVGKRTETPHGSRPPRFRTIDVGVNRKREVPWGELTIPALPGASIATGAVDNGSGPVYIIQVTSPKKHKKVIEDFFDAIEKELKVHSIYRGHVVIGAHDLKFLDLSGFDASKIVFSDQVQDTLDAALFTVLTNPEAVKRQGMKLRRAVLAYGPYGTGKSSLGLIVAQLATASGWTFLSAKAGHDNIRDVMLTAKLYQRAVVFVEDIDAHTPSANDRDGVAELLDLFDGIAVKDDEIIVVMTTNHIERVTAGMLRPGRLDYIVEIEALDRNGTERLLRAVIPAGNLDRAVDFGEVYDAMPKFQPAWVKAVAERALSFALARTGGRGEFRLTTADLVGAAKSLHPQLELMRAATEGHTEPEVHTALRNLFAEGARKGLDGGGIVDEDGDRVYGWSLAAEDKK
jgi:transitional endoplasmic reticulum ATPase